MKKVKTTIYADYNKDTFNLYENEMVKQQEEEEELNYKDFEGLDEDWEDFNST